MAENVIPLRPGASSSPAPLPLATVQSGASRITYGGVNDTYHGEILLPTGEVALAYIKDLDERELASELIVAWLAKTLGWRVPETYLAHADPSILSLSKAPVQADGSHLVLASTDAATPSLRQFYKAEDYVVTTILVRKLAASSWVGDLYGIDTWLANTDRNLGNILVGANDIWFIDHGRCFNGPTGSAAPLDPTAEYPNLISVWLTPQISDADRPLVAAAAGRSATVPDGLLDQVALLSHASAILTPAEASALISFLKDRREHVSVLAGRALNLLVA